MRRKRAFLATGGNRQPTANLRISSASDRSPLLPREVSNFALPAYSGPIVKDNYWRWPERDQAGNTSDFCMRVLG